MNAIITIGILFVMTLPVAIVAYVYSSVLTKPHHIFEGLKNYLENHLPEYLYLPLIGCYRCVTGQALLWSFPFIICPAINIHYNIWLQIFFISMGIYNVEFIKFFFDKISFEEREMKKEISDPPELRK